MPVHHYKGQSWGFAENIIVSDRAPLVTDDNYRIGQIWVHEANTFYVCLDNTPGAALWSGGGGSLAVQDEGIPVGIFPTMNFVGVDVLAYDAGAGVVNVTIPPATFRPFYNTGAATVASFPTSNWAVSAPTLTAFKLGGWVPGTLHPCHNDTTLDMNTPATCGFMNNTTTTIEVNVYDDDGVSVIANHTTAAIVGNIDVTVNNIRIRVTGWAADGTRWQGNIYVNIDAGALFPLGGRWSYNITHHNAGTDYSKTQAASFLDVETNAGALAGVTIAETAGNVVTKYLSGVQYYDIGSEFTVDIADIDYANSNSYPDPQVPVDGAEYGLPQLNLYEGDMTGWTVDDNNVDDTYQKTDWAITAINYRRIPPASDTTNIRARVNDWVNGAWVNSPDSRVLIDTYGVESDVLSEYFTDEAQRLTSAGAAWDSTQNIIAYDGGNNAQVIGGIIKIHDTDFSLYNPLPNPNYSASPPTGKFHRNFTDNFSLVRGSAVADITGFTLADLVAGRVQMWIDIPTRFTSPCYVHGPATYNFGTFTGNNDPIRLLSSTANSIAFSFGFLGLTPAQNFFKMQIIIVDPTIEPSSILISW